MTEMPLVSIIIPSYNHKNFIPLLIRSVKFQTYQNIELIVIDDGSTDESPEILAELKEELNFKLILKSNEGLCKTLNCGIAQSSGTYLVMIGSDDTIPLNRISEQVNFMIAHPEVDVVAGAMKLIDASGNVTGEKNPAIVGRISFEQMLITNRVFAPTAMIRRAVFDRWGNYPEHYLHEDYYLWLKVLEKGGQIHNVNQVWAFYRITNEDLEKKFIWYYCGASQALDAYKHLPIAEARKKIHLFALMIKLSLLLGNEALKKHYAFFKDLNFFYKVLVSFVSILPEIFRIKLMKFLKIRT
jgi:alpha-1,3-rhamnosyltransferase